MRGSKSTGHIAFYGTLMSGFGELDRLGARGQLRLLGPCLIGGVMFDVGEWPTLVLGDGTVQGELFEILDEGVFARLDPFEDYNPGDRAGSSFVRRRVQLLEPDLDAWVYVANGAPSDARPVTSGSWYSWTGARRPGSIAGDG
jgi:gamma-glutamylcyclotransferase (GGCT)/AIG2-like uncharacterized protein YtfP